MPEFDPPQRRGTRDNSSDHRIQQLEAELKLLVYKHDELAKDFLDYQKQTHEKMKWNTGMLFTFIGSIIIPAVAIIITIFSRSNVSP